MNSYCSHGGEKTCDEDEETEFFDQSKKEEIIEFVGTLEDKEFVTQEEISHVIDKESKDIDEIKDVIEDHGDVEFFYFVKVDKFFEEENQMIELVEINCRVGKLIENCDTAKVDTVVSMEKLKQNHGDIENLSGGNYYFLLLGDFLSDVKN